VTGHLDIIPAERLRAEFGLADARAILLVGSRAGALDYPGSDVDFLGVFDSADDIPATIGHPAAVSMATSVGPNWLGRIDGEEINVALVAAGTVRRIGALLARPISPTNLPVLQQYEIGLLQRLRTAVPLTGGDYVAGLVAPAALDRLPAAVFVLYHVSAAGHLESARRLLDAGDPATAGMVTMAVTAALGLAALSVYDHPAGSVKKVATDLAALQRRHPDPPVRLSDLADIGVGPPDRSRLALAGAALERLRRAAGALATGSTYWAEACHTIGPSPGGST
jgi:hypothetical protein